jgi:hypothetical protein
MAELEPLAEAATAGSVIGCLVRSYEDLHSVFRQRAQELDLPRLELDRISGLSPGYSAKLLAPRPLKRLSAGTFALLLPSLGLQLRVEQDHEAMRRFTQHAEKHGVRVPERALRWGGKHGTQLVSRRWVKRIARMGGKARARALTPAQRSASARAAARARWSKARQARPGNGRKNPRSRHA